MRQLVPALVALLAGCSAQDCKSMKGSFMGSVLCGGTGTEAEEPTTPPLSKCQPRDVMPTFFSLIDNDDPSLSGLRGAIGDLGRPVCLVPADRTCKSDDQCAVGQCQSGLCPCETSYSPLTDVLGVSLRAMSTIAGDARETNDPTVPPPGCLSAAAAENLPLASRNRMCELRRTLDILLQQNAGASLANDPQIKKVLISLMDYVQGKTDPDGATHYDLLTPVGRMAGADTQSCDPAALWTLLDNMFGYLTPQIAGAQLGAVQVLLADPYTKTFLSSLSGGGGGQGRDSIIVLANTLLTPAIVNQTTGAAALDQITTQILNPFVYNSSNVPQSFKDEVKAVMTNSSGLLADSTGIFPPLKKVLACAASPEIRCSDPAHCDPSHDNELVGALYDVISLPEAQGGVDFATLVGALKTLTTLDQTGQTGRTIRMIVQGIEGSPDPNDAHEARDAVAALAKQSLTAEEGQKLVPALETLVQKQVVTEMLSLLQDLLYTCNPPPPAH